MESTNASITDQWRKKMWYTCILDYYFHYQKNNKILQFASSFTQLEDIMLSEASQTQKSKFHMSSAICGNWNSKKKNIRRQKKERSLCIKIAVMHFAKLCFTPLSNRDEECYSIGEWYWGIVNKATTCVTAVPGARVWPCYSTPDPDPC